MIKMLLKAVTRIVFEWRRARMISDLRRQD